MGCIRMSEKFALTEKNIILVKATIASMRKYKNELHVSDAFKIADMIVIDVRQLVRLEGK